MWDSWVNEHDTYFGSTLRSTSEPLGKQHSLQRLGINKAFYWPTTEVKHKNYNRYSADWHEKLLHTGCHGRSCTDILRDYNPVPLKPPQTNWQYPFTRTLTETNMGNKRLSSWKLWVCELYLLFAGPSARFSNIRKKGRSVGHPRKHQDLQQAVVFKVCSPFKYNHHSQIHIFVMGFSVYEHDTHTDVTAHFMWRTLEPFGDVPNELMKDLVACWMFLNQVRYCHTTPTFYSRIYINFELYSIMQHYKK